MPPSFLSLIWQRWYPDNTAESRVESTFRSKTTTARQLSQRTTSGTEKFFGIFHTIRVHKFLQITTEVFVHHIAQIGLVCFKQCTQFLQRKRGVKKYLTYLKLVQYTFIYITIHLANVCFLSGKLLFPLPLDSLEKQSLLSLGSSGRAFTSQK